MKDRKHNLNDFIKAMSMRRLRRNDLLAGSYVTDAKGTPLGSRQKYVNDAYKTWAKTVDASKYDCGHFKTKCNSKCKSRGHPLHECPCLKAHLAAKLGRPLNGKNAIWKRSLTVPPNILYYHGFFLKRM